MISLKKLGLAIMVGLALSGSAKVDAQSADENLEFTRLTSMPRDLIAPILRAFPPEKKARWIERLRKDFDPQKSWKDSTQTSTILLKELLMLGDDAMGQWLFEQFKEDVEYQGAEILVFWHSSEAIEYLAGLCFSEAKLDPNATPADRRDLSFEAPGLLNKLLAKMDSLPQSVRDWAGGLEGDYVQGYDRIEQAREAANVDQDLISQNFLSYRARDIAKHWWAVNAQAVKEKRWKDVVRGESFVSPELDRMLDRLRKVRPAVHQAEMTGAASVPSVERPVEKPAPTTVRATPTVASAESGNWRLALYIAGGVAALLAAIGLVIRAVRKGKG
jgi:hypothetical protein